MNIGIVGLGRIGSAVAQRLLKAHHSVLGFDIDPQARQYAASQAIEVVDTLALLGQKTNIIFIFVPAGIPVENTIETLIPHLQPHSIIIDGGNSYFQESIVRAKKLHPHNITFIDCGTSGGVHGLAHGFCLMIGGNKQVYAQLEPVWRAIAAPNGYNHVGPSGAGHYVKMVHNGIEYALMQAYAEGFHLLHATGIDGRPFDLEQIAQLWNHGSVIRSFLLELTANIFAQDQQLHKVSGKVAHTGTGQWTVQEAKQHNIPVTMIAQALATREWSQQSGGNYTTKILALLRQQFGGHAINTISYSEDTSP